MPLYAFELVQSVDKRPKLRRPDQRFLESGKHLGVESSAHTHRTRGKRKVGGTALLQGVMVAESPETQHLRTERKKIGNER